MSKKALSPEYKISSISWQRCQTIRSIRTTSRKPCPKLGCTLASPVCTGRSRSQLHFASMPMWWPGSKNTHRIVDIRLKSTACYAAMCLRHRPDTGFWHPVIRRQA